MLGTMTSGMVRILRPPNQHDVYQVAQITKLSFLRCSQDRHNRYYAEHDEVLEQVIAEYVN